MRSLPGEVTGCEPLQLMPKKKKKKTVSAVEERSEETAAAGGSACLEPDGGTMPASVAGQPGASVPLPGLGGQVRAEPEVPMSRKEPEESAVGGEKKKRRKPGRVQVALNTLRKEGLNSFREYIEAEIGEMDLLRRLAERIMRAEDLGGIKAEAVAQVEALRRLLDPESGPHPESGPLMPQAVASLLGQGIERPVLAQIKTELSKREKDLFATCFRGDLASFKHLLRRADIDINMANKFGTILCLAAFKGHARIVRELLSRPGIDVNLAHLSGTTPLYLATQQGHVEVVKLLLATPGINANLANLRGTAPLCVASHLGQVEVVRLLLNAPNIRVNARKEIGTTALFAASQVNHTDIVELLIKRGADVNITLTQGTSPLCVATAHGYFDVVRLLLEAPGVQIDQKTCDGVTPLGIASKFGYEDIVRLLLRHGADPNGANINELTPLHTACIKGKTAIVRMLLHAGADMDAEVEIGRQRYTPYSLAVLGGHREVLSVLAPHRQAQEAAARLGTLSLEDEPGLTTPPSPSPEPLPSPTHEPLPLPAATAAAQTEQQPSPAHTVSDSQPAAAETLSPLAQGKQALVRDILRKLDRDTLEPLEGIRMMMEVRKADSLDSVCAIYNRLAGIERQQERARRRDVRHGLLPISMSTPAPEGADPRFALDAASELDAEGVEVEIRRHLSQRYHRFVSQAVNNMEFGRGKPTTGFPGLWHVSAGVPGVGSCSVFYYTDGTGKRIRVVGVGHHVGPAAYRLDYAAGELGGVGRVLCIA